MPTLFVIRRMASKPVILHLAVVNDWKPTLFGMFFFA